MPHLRAVLRFPLCRLWPGFRKPIWFSSGQSVCSGCGSESISWVRESEFRMVICVPRATVSAAGQMVLFWITSVFALVLGVQPPLGPAGVVELLLPHAAATASPAANVAPPAHVPN